MQLRLVTKYEGVYRNALELWADETGSEALDAWDGPGVYVADAGYLENGTPYATYRRV